MNYKIPKALVLTFIFCIIITISDSLVAKAVAVILYAMLIAIINNDKSDDF